MAVHPAIEGLLTKAREDPDLLAVILFGSAARGEHGSSSDLDVCLVLSGRNHPPIRLSEKKLEYAARHAAVDVQVFQQLPLYVRRRVLREGRVLWARDEEMLYELAFRTAQEFEDFRPRYEEYLRSVERGRS
ncbi:MAG: type VII toxin-antitoxin system MntA family adenylyltransferase antitoxin [Candidatus Binatia bacterium]